jgi:transposase
MILYVQQAQGEAMARVGVAITRTVDVKELRRMARAENSGRVAARMFAIANVLSGMSRELSARLAGMDRQTLRDWVHRFNEKGVEGLRDLPHTGRPRELDEESRKKLLAFVEKGPDPVKDGIVRWRRIDLKLWLEKECGISYDETSVGRILRELGFSHVSVRPEHPEADPVAMEDFKKTLRRRSKKPFPPAPKTSLSNSGSRTKQGLGKKAR